MSKRTAFSRKSEQRHWRLRHDQEEAERRQKRAQKFERRAGGGQPFDMHAAQDASRDEDTSTREADLPHEL